MTEILTTKSREILGECTEEWQKNPVEPLEGVTILHNKMGELARTYSTYLSTSVSSGGWIRDKTLSQAEVISANGKTALRYADYLHRAGLIDLHRSVDAVSLGHVPTWRQYEYLKFWLPVMGRVELSTENVREIQSQLTEFENSHDMDLFNDSSAPQTERRPLHAAFERQFVRATQNMGSHAVEQVVQLIDASLSLGGDTERDYANDTDIAVKRPAFAGTPEEMIRIIDDPELASQFEQLSKLGAHIVEVGDTPAMTLKMLGAKLS